MNTDFFGHWHRISWKIWVQNLISLHQKDLKAFVYCWYPVSKIFIYASNCDRLSEGDENQNDNLRKYSKYDILYFDMNNMLR